MNGIFQQKPFAPQFSIITFGSEIRGEYLNSEIFTSHLSHYSL